MKNIHVLPTPNPSRLIIYSTLLNELRLLDEPIEDWNHKRHIYITSDEEINQQTKPCWCINTIKNTWNNDLIYYQGAMPQYHFKGFKKIILTTDQDLIKNGVQSIDNEFLEWFVKNPSCEEVEVENIPNNSWGFDLEEPMNLGYKIIISKEEPKTIKDKIEDFVEKCRETHLDRLLSEEEPKQEYEYQSECICGTECKKFTNVKCKNPKQVWEQLIEDCGGKEEFMKSAGLLPKQETIEEAAEKYANNWEEIHPELDPEDMTPIEISKIDFIEGAKWQQEQDKNRYSEEEVRELFTQYKEEFSIYRNMQILNAQFGEWFEQFKKK